MAGHVRILGILHIVFGALALVGGLILGGILGGAAGLVGMSGDNDALVAIPILGTIGVFVFLLLALLGLPGIIAGWGLLNYKGWARILTIVLSVLNLFNVPIGTALGIYGLYVLLSAEGTRLFENRGMQPARY
ncbi:MAG: hypothetical protein SFV54_03010 [Bryobacteraceae bacterium]|nr:hypothetical protein [Bryobacteraceae bacterium]